MAPSAILPEYPCISTYINMSQLIYPNANSPRPNNLSNRKPEYVDRKLDVTTIRLIKAPSVDEAPMWKGQAFDFDRDRLRGKIGGAVTADSVITVIGEHFPMSTMTVEQEARRVISTFRSVIIQVDNLTPSIFLDRAGKDMTGGMYRNPRSANVCHLGVDALIPMSDLSLAFKDRLSTYALSYYLPLPQSFQVLNPSANTSAGTTSLPSDSVVIAPSSAADALNADIFSPSVGGRIHQPIKFLAQESQALTPPINRTSLCLEMKGETKEHGPASDGDGDGDDDMGNSNDNDIFKTTPKAANLMRAR